MLTISDIEPLIEREFGSRLEPLGFRRLNQRKWVRSRTPPLRELFVLEALKGGYYSPAWGFSSGLVPSLKGGSFKRQSTDKNAVMDLVINPIDAVGMVPPQAFSFITGADTEIPSEQIRACAEHFVPLALSDFDRVRSVQEFCEFFLLRSRLQYRRFPFDMYVQHQLVHGFVLVLMGSREAGRKRIQEFCGSMNVEFDDPVLSECVRVAENIDRSS